LGCDAGLLKQDVERSNKKTWKPWGLAAVVNLGAAVLAFAAWQRFQSPQSPANGLYRGGVLYEPVDDVRYIPRADARMTARDTNGPRYRLGADGQPVRDGTFGDPDPYNWRRWIGLQPVDKGEASKLATAVVAEAMSELRRLYPGIRMHFISYWVASWSDTGLSNEDLAAFEYDLSQAGVMPLPLAAVIPRYRFALPDYVLDRTDLHPNARAHRLIGEFILREVRPPL
jgi:hypothetical protein